MLNEAMACGKAVLASEACGAAADLVWVDRDVSDVAAARQAVLDKLDRLAPVEDLEEVYRRFPTLRGQVA